MKTDKQAWEKEFSKIEICPQRQDSTSAQLIDLIKIANRFGFYDAADFLKTLHLES